MSEFGRKAGSAAALLLTWAQELDRAKQNAAAVLNTRASRRSSQPICNGRRWPLAEGPLLSARAVNADLRFRRGWMHDLNRNSRPVRLFTTHQTVCPQQRFVVAG